MGVYMLSRKRKEESEWKSNSQGNLGYILTLLQLNFDSPELTDFEYKIERVE